MLCDANSNSTLNPHRNSFGFGLCFDQIAEKHHNIILDYWAALFFAVGIAAVALVLDIFFVRMAKNEKEGWEEDDLIMGELSASAVTMGTVHKL